MNRTERKQNESIIIVNGTDTVGLIDKGSEISTHSKQCSSILFIISRRNICQVTTDKVCKWKSYRGVVGLTIGVPALKGC